jgi:AraC family transcriptional regulator
MRLPAPRLKVNVMRSIGPMPLNLTMLLSLRSNAPQSQEKATAPADTGGLSSRIFQLFPVCLRDGLQESMAHSPNLRPDLGSRITLNTTASGEPVLYPDCGSPLLLSTGAPWNNVLKLEQHRFRGEDLPEVYSQTHIVVLRLSPPITEEWRIAGRWMLRAADHPSDLCVFSEGTAFQARHHDEVEDLFLALSPNFVAATAEQVAARAHRFELTSSCLVEDPAIRHVLLALQADLRAGCPAGRLYGEGLATALTTHLLRNHTVIPFRIADYRGGLTPARLRCVLEHMEAHLSSDVGLKALADVAKLSPHHFAALFKASTGLPPHRYVLQRRIARAQELLVRTQGSLAEIGYELGFSSQSHFATMFRRAAGISPSAYRAERRR